MRLVIPLTGTVLSYNAELAKYGGSSGIAGDLNDPVKPVPINLGHVNWRLVSIDLEDDSAEIEVTPSDRISVPTGKFEMVDTDKKDAEGKPIYEKMEIYEIRQTTEIEKQGFLDYAENLVESHTKDELYAMTGVKRLVKPANMKLEKK